MRKIILCSFLLLLNSFCIQAQISEAISFSKNITFESDSFVQQIKTSSNTSIKARILLFDNVEIQDLKIKLPDGRKIEEVNAPSFGIEIVRFSPSNLEETLLSPTRTIFININATSSGIYEISGAGSNLTAVVPIEVQIYGNYRFELIKPSTSILHPNVPKTLAIKVTTIDGLPVTEGTVEAKVVKLGEVSFQTFLVDDGQGNDSLAGDGIYTGDVTVENVGRYALEVETTIIDNEVGSIFSVTQSELNVVAPFPVELTGEFIETTIDSNSNGLIDELKLTFKTIGTVPDDDEYSLVVSLETSTKQRITNPVMITNDDLPDITVSFSGLRLWKKHESGPIKILSARINSFNAPARPGLRDMGFISNYNKNDFERPNEVINQPQANTSLVDDNGDSVYDKVNISFEANVLVDGKYETTGLLRGANGTELKFFKAETLTGGNSTVDVPVYWNKILDAGLSGPAQIVYLDFYQIEDLSWSIVEKKYFGETPEFECWDFGDCSAHVPNTPPVANDDNVYAIQNFSSVNMSLLGNDADADGDTLNLSFNQPTNGSVGYLEAIGKLVYIPNATYSGTDNFDYTITDTHPTNNFPKGGSDSAIVNVQVRSNAAPSIFGDSADVPFETRVAIDVLANDSDADGDTLEVISVDQPTHGQVELIDNIVYYTPNAGYSGPDNFTHHVKEKDEPSGLVGNTTYNVPVSLNVFPPNALPIAQSDSYTLRVNEQLNMDVLVNDSDADEDSLTITTVFPPLHGTAQVIGGTSISYTAPEQVTIDSFTYEISDGKGGTSQTTVSVNVIEPNYAPIAVNDSGIIQEGSSQVFDVLANDSDANGDLLIVTNAVFYNTPIMGTLSVEDNKLRFSAYSNSFGTQIITYTVSDPYELTSQGQLSITINRAPVASNDSFTVLKEQSTSLSVLDNDTDYDGNSLVISSVTSSANATTEILNNQISYIPVNGFIGTDSLTYSVDDGFGGTSQSTVSIFVNAAPSAIDDDFSFGFNTSQALDVTVNDFDENIGDSIQLVSVGEASHGITAIENNKVKYTPEYNFVGFDQFSYTLEDSYGQQSTASVSVSINELPVETVEKLHARPIDQGNIITWNAARHAISYRLYWGDNVADVQNQAQFIDVQGTHYYHKGLTNGVTYFYQIEGRGVTTTSIGNTAIQTSTPSAVGVTQRQREYDWYEGAYVGVTDLNWTLDISGFKHMVIERGGTRLVAKTFDPKYGWSQEYELSTTSGDDTWKTQAVLRSSESGYAVFAWVEGKDILTALYDPNTRIWSNSDVIVDGDEIAYYNQITKLTADINNHGQAVVTWEKNKEASSSSVRNDIYMAKYSPDTKWGNVENVAYDSRFHSEAIEATINDLGSIAVVYNRDFYNSGSYPTQAVFTEISGIKRTFLLDTLSPFASSVHVPRPTGVPYMDNFNNLRVITPDLRDHYYSSDTDSWEYSQITPVSESVRYLNIKFGTSINAAAVSYYKDDIPDLQSGLKFSNEIGIWSEPILEKHVTIKGLSSDKVSIANTSTLQTYHMDSASWTSYNTGFTSEPDNTYQNQKYSSIADGYGNFAVMYEGWLQEYIALNSDGNNAPIVGGQSYISHNESTDIIINAANVLDIDNDIVSWKWEHVSGPYVLFRHPNDATTEAYIGTTISDDLSVSKLTVTDFKGNSAEGLYTIPIVNVLAGSDTDAPTSTIDVTKWTSRSTRISYKNIKFSVDEEKALVLWMYSGDDTIHGTSYAKDVWHVYEKQIGFTLSDTGGRIYYYAIDRSGNKESIQDVRIGGKGK